MIGKVEIGVGRTYAMLREAQRRVKRAGWANVDLLESDVADDEYSGDGDREKGPFTREGPPKNRSTEEAISDRL